MEGTGGSVAAANVASMAHQETSARHASRRVHRPMAELERQGLRVMAEQAQTKWQEATVEAALAASLRQPTPGKEVPHQAAQRAGFRTKEKTPMVRTGPPE